MRIAQCFGPRLSGQALGIAAAITPAIAVLCLAAALSGCFPALGAQAARLKVGFTLSGEFSAKLAGLSARSTASQDGARTLHPSAPWVAITHSISGSGPGGASFSLQTASGSAEARLIPGEWSITVTGYSGSGMAVVSGSGSAMLEAGRESDLFLTLAPLQGTGSLTLSLSVNYPVASEARITGNLVREGFPGETPGALPYLPLPIDIPATQGSLAFASLPAGFYTLSMSMADGSGTLGGISETVLVLAGYDTDGICSFELGTPQFTLGFRTDPATILDGLVIQSPMRISKSRPFAVAAARALAGTTGSWTINGIGAGQSRSLSDASSPLSQVAISGTMDASSLPLLSRIDFLADPDDGGARGSASGRLETLNGPSGARWSWRASIDADSSETPSLFRTGDPYNTGTGATGTVRAVASSGNGVVAVSGLDGEGALHLFLSVPGGAGFIRLWRDRILVGSSVRNADRLALSEDGRMLAAAATTGTWLRICFLTEKGDIAATRDLTYSSPGLPQFDSIRSLRFSRDGSRLYALANSPESIYTFDVNRETASAALRGRFDLDALQPGQAMSMSDLTVGPDGLVAASASGIGTLYLLSPSADGLSLSGSLDRAAGGWTSPERIAFDDSGLTLYVLTDGSALKALTRAATGTPLTGEGVTIPIPAVVHPAKFMALAPPGTAPSPASSTICVAGGPGIVFLEIPHENPELFSTDSVLPSSSDFSAAGNVVDCAFAGETLLAAGGTKGIVSAFAAY